MKDKRNITGTNSIKVHTLLKCKSKKPDPDVSVDELMDKLYAMNLLSEKEMEIVKKRQERIKLYKDLRKKFNLSHNKLKQRQIAGLLQKLDSNTFSHFTEIHKKLIENECCTYEIESKYLHKVCSIYIYMGFKVKSKFTNSVYNGFFKLEIKPHTLE